MATNTTVTRRSLVGACLAETVGLLANAPTARAAGAERTWDAECDVLIVGSGYTGLAAAIEADAAGADVKIIDKRPSFGGNSIIADGDFAVCGSSAQKAQGVEDSVDDYVNDMLAAGLNLNDVEKCRVIAEKSNETWEWTQDYLGVSFVTLEDGNIELLPYGGHSNYRTMKPVGAGAAYVTALGDKVEEAGMEVETGVMMTKLITDETGRVIGVEASEGVTDNDPSTGTPIAIKARKAVILATGGFAGDVEWRKQHDPTVDESIDTTNREGSTSEALQAAMRAGALGVHMDWIQLGPWCSPDETHCGAAWTYIDVGFPYGPCIDPRTCKRITSELQDRKRLCDAIVLCAVFYCVAGSVRDYVGYENFESAEGFRALVPLAVQAGSAAVLFVAFRLGFRSDANWQSFLTALVVAIIFFFGCLFVVVLGWVPAAKGSELLMSASYMCFKLLLLIFIVVVAESLQASVVTAFSVFFVSVATLFMFVVGTVLPFAVGLAGLDVYANR